MLSAFHVASNKSRNYLFQFIATDKDLDNYNQYKSHLLSMMVLSLGQNYKLAFELLNTEVTIKRSAEKATSFTGRVLEKLWSYSTPAEHKMTIFELLMPEDKERMVQYFKTCKDLGKLIPKAGSKKTEIVKETPLIRALTAKEGKSWVSRVACTRKTGLKFG